MQGSCQILCAELRDRQFADTQRLTFVYTLAESATIENKTPRNFVGTKCRGADYRLALGLRALKMAPQPTRQVAPKRGVAGGSEVYPICQIVFYDLACIDKFAAQSLADPGVKAAWRPPSGVPDAVCHPDQRVLSLTAGS